MERQENKQLTLLTDKEFELIDALYFTLPFGKLQAELGWEESVLKKELEALVGKGWVKCMKPVTDEEVTDPQKFSENYRSYNYLATKKGLLEHNSR